MTRFLALWMLVLAVALTGSMLIPAPASADVLSDAEKAPLSAAELERLRKGEVIVSEPAGAQGGARFVLAKALIDRPVDTVWNSLYDQERLFKGDPRMRKVETLSKPSPNRQKVAYSLNISRLLPTFDYVTAVNYTPDSRSVKFDRVSGSFRAFKGVAKLKPVDNGKRTVLFYALQVDPGFMVPQMVVRSILRSELPGILSNIKRNIYSASPVLTNK